MRRFDVSMIVSLRLSRLQFHGARLSAPSRLPSLLPWSRHLLFGTARLASTRTNRVYHVPVGSNGHVSLRVVQPKTQPRPGSVIIRLPSGPILHRSFADGDVSRDGRNEAATSSAYLAADDVSSARALADETSSTVVTINYRLGEVVVKEKGSRHSKANNGEHQPKKLFYQFPTPVHDALTGFDWVLKNLQPNRLGVIGAHIGGSLGLTLALTEPRHVHAVAALDPVCDWTSLDEFCTSTSISTSTSTRRKPHHAPRDLVPLLEARERFFATPERYFDSFASPILFLRSAGKDVPKVFPKYLTGPEYPVPLLTKESEESLEPWDAYLPEYCGYEDADASGSEELGSDEQRKHPVRRRKALSRWPPYGLDYGTSGPRRKYSREPVEKLEITLPWVRLFTHQDFNTHPTTPEDIHQPDGPVTHKTPPKRHRRNHNATVLCRQANETVDVMRRACFWGREKGFAEERVTLFSMPDSFSIDSKGLDPRVESEDLTFHAGQWLGDTLRTLPDTDTETEADPDS